MYKPKIHFLRKMPRNINIFILKKKREYKRKEMIKSIFSFFFFSILFGAEKVYKGRNSIKGKQLRINLIEFTQFKNSHSRYQSLRFEIYIKSRHI